jgi:hypothetical protein
MKTKSRVCLILLSMVLIFLINSCSKFEYLSGNEVKGFADGSVIDAKFNNPTAMDVDDSGNLYVIDQDYKVIRKITPDGKVSTVISFKDDFANLLKIKDNFLYFSNGVSIKRINLKEEVKVENVVGDDNSEIGSNNKGDVIGDFDIARFNFIYGLTLDNENNIFIVDNLYTNSIPSEKRGYKIKRANLKTRKVELITFENEGSSAYSEGGSVIDLYNPDLISRGKLELIEINPKNHQLYYISSNTFNSVIFKISSKNQILNLGDSEIYHVGSFIFDNDGNMYVVAIDSEKLYKISSDNKKEEITGFWGVLKFDKDNMFPETGGWEDTHLAFDNNKKILYMSTSSNKIFKLNLGR